MRENVNVTWEYEADVMQGELMRSNEFDYDTALAIAQELEAADPGAGTNLDEVGRGSERYVVLALRSTIAAYKRRKG